MDAARYTAMGVYVRNLRESHDLAKAARGISQSLSPPGGVLARVYDCRGDSWPRFSTLSADSDYEVRAISKELRLLASEAGFTGSSHALLRRFNDNLVLAVVLPRYKSPKLLIDFLTAANSGASQFRIEISGAQLFRSLFPSPARARDVFISRILRDALPIVHASARRAISSHAAV